MRTPRDLAAVTAGAVLLVNLVAEHFLFSRRLSGGVLIPGLLDFHPAWNRGVSFSLLWQDSRTGSWLLVAGLVVIIIILGAIAWRSRDWLGACGLGLVIGGALGNLYDRLAYDLAVFDFLFLHLGRTPLFVCNIADIAITAGALCLIAESLRRA
ncbi:MAG TPA: signal peptidase II [Rhizomicrobium sp.]|nr:signal peptidase II [Rhizomicrobium sp.]